MLSHTCFNLVNCYTNLESSYCCPNWRLARLMFCSKYDTFIPSVRRFLLFLISAISPNTKQNLKVGLRKSGIFPLNRTEILQDYFQLHSSKSTRNFIHNWNLESEKDIEFNERQYVQVNFEKAKRCYIVKL